MQCIKKILQALAKYFTSDYETEAFFVDDDDDFVVVNKLSIVKYLRS